ncbi:hypothetical protein INT45_009737 [Circinella minor]|uniref:Uncharacterized protein n=1 Tax=Circinella minor TaxID=1195481 RepID=A0A8H7VNF2_9FUNG|nr:hypothetical protein INT45_009737 [Circinella minor]
MSVQAAIALLNKNNSSTTSSSTAPITKPSIGSSWKPNNVTTTATPPVDNDKKIDSKRVRTRTQSGGVASILSKFDQQPAPVTSSSTKTATPHIGTTTSSSSSNDSNNDNNNNTTNIVVSNNNKKTSSNCNFEALAKTPSEPSSTNTIMTLTPEKPTTSTSTSTLTTKPAIITTPSSSTSTIIRKPTKIVGRQRSATVSAHVAAITRRSRSASVRDRAATINRTVIADTIGHELLAIYQDTLNKLQAAEEEIEKLNQQQQINAITTTSNSNDNNNELSEDKKMSSQLRDYEIRIQYLSEKLDQLSQEHNLLERQLDQERKQQRMNSKRVTLDTPISPEFRPFSKFFDTANTTTTTTSTTTGDELDRRRITVETNLTSEDGEFWNCLLDSYEDKGTFFSSLNTSITTGEEDSNSSNINKVINSVSATLSTDESNNNKEQQQQLVLAELLFVKKQLTAVEKGAQIMLERHLQDLEKERQQTRTLTEVVHKQDQLIASLEIKAYPKEMKDEDDSNNNNNNNNQHLLLEQVELQRIELEDKRGLLTRLLDEREELLRQVMNHNSNKSLPMNGIRSRSASVRSSIDVLSEMSKDNPIANPATKHPLSRASSSSLLQISPRSSLGSHVHGRSTPPPTGPPKNPLPPLPPRSSSSMHSILSPATSWSSADYAAATGRYSGNNQQPSQQHYFNNVQQQQQRELVNSTTCKESSQPSNTMIESPLPPHPSTFLNHYSSQQEQPVWLDYQSNEKKQQQLQQQSPQPQPQTSSTINRSTTIKLKKSNSNGNTTFWKGWKHRLGSR